MISHDLCAESFAGYRLLDSGEGAKLEDIGGHRVQRPCPQAIWSRQSQASEWERARSICHRTKDGGGRWEHRSGDPQDLRAQWTGPCGSLSMRLRFTGFGHCGMFPEQAPVWTWLQERCRMLAKSLGRPPKIANCFAYTGCGSVVCAAAGAEVFHVDSAKGILSWCQENIAANPGLPGSVRCVHEDTRAFLRFALKRGFRYDGIVLDPPAWGHGKSKETWTIDSDLMDLLRLSAECLHPGGFIHLGCHAPGVQRAALVTCLKQVATWNELCSGDYAICHHGDERLLPAGIYAWASLG